MVVVGSPIGSIASPAMGSWLGVQYQARILLCRPYTFNQTAVGYPPDKVPLLYPRDLLS